MSISYYNQVYILNMFTLDSYMTMEGLDLAITEEILLMRTSRTATFTLSSSSSTSSFSSNLYNHQNGRTTTITTTITTTMCSSSSTTSYVSEHRPLRHSQSVMLDNQRHRPIIQDPYQLSPNLELLNNWMIVSFYIHLCNYFVCDKSQSKFPTLLLVIVTYDKRKTLLDYALHQT